MLIEPETFMNKSGASLMPLVKSKKAAEKVIVIYDDLDLPVGRMKVSFNRSSGGHKGVESIIKAVKTEAFARIRVGISPVTAAGKTKKPSGDEAVADFILGKFSPKEYEALKKIFKTVPDAVAKIISDGAEMAMGEFNK
jgi:PTH1 family peptidyl-tRNA hydrolase